MITLTKDMYVPALSWRLAEYQALFELTDDVKDRIVPFLTIPQIEFDFETWEMKKTIQKHISPFPIKFNEKWSERPAWIGVHRDIANKSMDDGQDVYTYVFQSLRSLRAKAIPEIHLVSPTTLVNSIKAIVKTDGNGVAVTISIEDLMKSETSDKIHQLTKLIGVEFDEVDLMINLGSPNFEPYDQFGKLLSYAFGKLDNLDAFRNFLLIGTAYPETFQNIAKGVDQIPRHDWVFYRKLHDLMPTNVRLPNFGDYTIVHPKFKAIDMRLINPAGKLVYTTPEVWEVRKGGSFRNNRKQMHEHCASIVRSGKFKGGSYSFGDDYIEKCAAQVDGPGSLTVWKKVAINHHITHVLEDLSKFFAVPYTPGSKLLFH